MAQKKNECQTCMKCNERKDVTSFYVSYSPLHASGRVPICKQCLQEYDAHDTNGIIEILRVLDKPFKQELYNTALLKGGDNVLGKYIRMLSLNYKTEQFKDSDGIANETKTITRINTELLRKQKELEELEAKTEDIKKKDFKETISDEVILNWGRGYTKDEYIMFEEKFKLIESSYPLKSTMHLESLRTYVRYAVKAELATASNDIASAKEWGKLANEASKKAKIDPSQLSATDLSQGLDTFSDLVRKVESAVDIIPILPEFIAKPKDKVDFTVLFYINYERHLRGLPQVEHKDVYDFYNKMVADYVENNPSDYSFLLDDGVQGNTHVERVYHYVFDVVIPKRKAENPNDPFYEHLDKWVRLVSFYRWYPDLFYQLIKPQSGAIRLDLDQCVLLRAMSRFKQVYGVFGRGSGKTFLEQLYGYHTCIFFPDLEMSMSAQTKENSSALIRDKFSEITRFYPMLKNEYVEKESRFADSLSVVKWKSGSRLDTLANQQSSKGQRRKRMVIEESAQVNAKLFEDVLEPIVNVPRRTIGQLSIINPLELNGQINFFTTSWYRGTSEFERNLKFFDDMVNLKGVMILGASYELNVINGRGEPKSAVLAKQEKLTPTAFALNYMSWWVGASDGALIAINKVMDLRVTTKADLKWDGKHEYIISCDVARSEHKENNQSSVVVLKLIKNKKGKLINVICVNIINYPSTVNFQTLAISLMKLKALYNAKAVVVDANGLGVGLVDELLKEQFDPETKESLGCWNTMNTDQEPEIDYAEECLYALKSQQINHDIIVSFTNYIESGKLQLLEKRQDAGYDINDDDYIKTEVLPFAQTDLLLEEIANLKLVMTERNNKLTVERISRKIDKDRYSALAYGLYYIKLYEENDFIIESDEDASDYCLIN